MRQDVANRICIGLYKFNPPKKAVTFQFSPVPGQLLLNVMGIWVAIRAVKYVKPGAANQ